MILKLVEGKVLINTMFVPELKSQTFVKLELEPNTQHLNPAIYINHLRFTEQIINISDEIQPGDVLIKVDLLDEKNNIIRTYSSKVPYNVYHILGNKPIRPDIEEYLYKLEEEIRSLKETIIILEEKHVKEINLLKEKHLEETTSLNKVIKELEEKGEIV